LKIHDIFHIKKILPHKHVWCVKGRGIERIEKWKKKKVISRVATSHEILSPSVNITETDTCSRK
jgi:hypothetical protein